MHAITALYGAVLFVLLTPGVILHIPSKGPLLYASIVHAIIFGILLYFISKITKEHFTITPKISCKDSEKYYLECCPYNTPKTTKCDKMPDGYPCVDLDGNCGKYDTNTNICYYGKDSNNCPYLCSPDVDRVPGIL